MRIIGSSGIVVAVPRLGRFLRGVSEEGFQVFSPEEGFQWGFGQFWLKWDWVGEEFHNKASSLVRFSKRYKLRYSCLCCLSRASLYFMILTVILFVFVFCSLFSHDLNVLYLCLQLLSYLYLYFTNTLYLYFSKTLYLQTWAVEPLLVMLSLFSQTHSGPGRDPYGISCEDYDWYDDDQNLDGEIIF